MLYTTSRPSIRITGWLVLCLVALIGLPLQAFKTLPIAHAAGVIYVRSTAAGAGNGSSWADAYTSLQSALAIATSGDEIWVAAGSYTPTTTTDRAASFTLKSGVAIYGGFAGSEAQLSERNWITNVTTLSGEIGNPNGSNDNNYHVVTGATGATLDGFTISGGYADGSGTTAFGGGIYNTSANPTLSNLIVSGNLVADGGAGIYNNASSPIITNVTISGNQASYGAALYNDNASSAVLTNVTISGNNANNNGGGIYNTLSSPTLTNMVVSGNTANQGGGIYNVSNSSPTLTNVTIAGNRAGSQGGGIYNNGGNAQVRNSIIWGNRVGTSVSAIYNNASTATASYSLVEGGYAGTGNLNSDPQFVAAVAASSATTTTGDYRLWSISPAIDAGDNSVVTTTTDRNGNPRKIDLLTVADTGSGTAPIVDMGAYESVDEIQFTTVSSITRFDPATSATSAASVTFQVVFAESLSSVDTSDFVLTLVSGQTAGSSITAVSGSGTTWLVTANLGDGAGVIRLDISSMAWALRAGGVRVSIEAFTSGETYTFDMPPPAPVISSITTDSGVQTSGRTSDSTISLNGTAEANSTITVSRAGIGVIGTTSANGAGVWSFDYTGTSLPLGSYTFSATATDAGGNTSPVSNSFIVTIVNFSGQVPELIYYRFDTAGTTVVNEASSPVGTNPAPILGQTIGNTGQFGSALVGTGESSDIAYVNTGWAPNLGTSSWTISFWIANVPSSSTLFYFFGDINSKSLRAFTNGVAGSGNVILRGDGLSDVLVTGAASSQANVVHFVYDSTVREIRAYKNGVLVNTVAQSQLNINGAGPFKVGGYNTTNIGLASGQLFDEFRLYNRALSATEVGDTWDQSLQTISLTKSVAPAVARPGDPVTYTITFANTSNQIANNLLITDTLSPDITNTTITTSGIALTQMPNAQYAWSAPTLGAHSGGVITITGTLASPLASGILTNTVLLSTAATSRTAKAALTITNLAPVANAGADQFVDTNQIVTLNGSGSSDANGDSLTYGWTQTGGPVVQLNDATASSPTFTSPGANTLLTFTLMVTDSLGVADPTPDEVVVMVNHECVAIAFPYTVPASDSAALSRAITCANLYPDANTINLTNSTYSFTSGDLTNSDSALPRITTPITITGNGATLERANGAPDFRLLDIEGGTMILDHLTLTGGHGGLGGGIRNVGDLTIRQSTVTGNSGDDGGGIRNEGGLTVIDSLITNNSAVGVGGGIDNTNNLTITDSTITNNTAGGGAGIRNQGGATVTGSTITNNTATFYGGGIANSGGLTLSDSTLSGNHVTASSAGGGGLINSGTATVTNSTISGNSVAGAGEGGGGICHAFGVLTLINSVISGNSAPNGGGLALIGDPSAATLLTNLTVAGNSADSAGGGILLDAGTLIMSNSIIWGNRAGGAASSITHNNGLPTVSYSLVEGGYVGASNLSSDPQFISPVAAANAPTTAGNYQLQGSSPALDDGDNSVVTATTDRNGNPRLSDLPAVADTGSGTAPIVDMGAYEKQLSPLSRLYVDHNATGANNGSSWIDAYTSLKSALNEASSGTQIWVAAGTYTPTDRSDRSVSFTLQPGVDVYGGFAGTETQLSQRDWTANVTTLSGDIGATDNESDNSYHVVTGANGATLDGFAISGGRAYGNNDFLFGSGIYNNSSSPTLRNLIISDSRSSWYGGAIYNTNSSPTLTNVTISGSYAGAYGGGIYNTNSSPTLINVTINDNYAPYEGGGIYNTNNSSPTLINVTISSNTAGSAAGIYNNGGSPTLTNVIISGNRGSNVGGMQNNGSSPTLTNVTITGNRSNILAAGIQNNSSTLQIRNSIIWGNKRSGNASSIDSDGESAIVSNSLVEGGYAGPGNLDADPMFVDAIAAANAPSTGGDYHLQGTSPAVNVGDLALLPIDAQDLDGDSNTAEAIPFDRDGSARVARGGLDLGAYERQSNNAPTLTQPTDLTIREDAGAQSVNLVGIGSGDGSQTFSISVVSSNPALIPTPIVSYASPNATGSLTFTPAANLSGTATITITLQDSGGTANGGVDTLTRSFTITITSVNDAPSFTAGPNQTVQASAGAITVTGWASGFTPGPANEIGQTVVGYTVVSNSAPQLFSNAPVINTSGVLTYTPMPGASGTATIGVVVQDSGGTVNGGADTSVVYTFTITVAGSYTVNLPLVLGS